MEIDFGKLLEHEPYELEIEGEKISINNGVFAPDPSLTNSPFIILNNLPPLKNKDVLDMGTGTGVIAIVCARKGARVIAVDNEDKALENAEENIRKSGLKSIKLIKSNLFENTDGKFDYIFANLPILDEIWDKKEKTTSTVESFLKEAPRHLKNDGKIYLPWFSVSNITEIQTIADNLDFKYEIKEEEKLGFTWYLLSFSRK